MANFSFPSRCDKQKIDMYFISTKQLALMVVFKKVLMQTYCCSLLPSDVYPRSTNVLHISESQGRIEEGSNNHTVLPQKISASSAHMFPTYFGTVNGW